MTYLIVDTETTGLDPMEDKLIAIGISGEWGNKRTFIGDEQEILYSFWKEVGKAENVILVGFNFDFDWTFLKLRSLKHKVPIIHFDKYTERMDLRIVLNSDRYKKGTTLSDYCAFLNIPDGDKLSGADMPTLYKEGNWDSIRKHLEFDLDKTAELFRRMRECGVV